LLAGRLVSDLASGTRVVGREERTDHELTALDRLDGASDLLDDAAVLVPHRGWLSSRLDAAIRPQIRPAHARGRDSDDGVRRLDDFRNLAFLEAYIARPVQDSSSHDLSPYFDFFLCAVSVRYTRHPPRVRARSQSLHQGCKATEQQRQ